MGSYSKIKLNVSLFVVIVNFLFLIFLIFLFDYWNNEFTTLLERTLITMASGIIFSALVIIVLVMLINSIEKVAMSLTDKIIELSEEQKQFVNAKINQINVFIFLSVIISWAVGPVFVSLIKGEQIINTIFVVRETFLLSLGLIIAPIHIIFINYLLNPIKSDLKIHKTIGISKSSIVRRRVLLMVFIPVSCIIFGVNFNYNNMQKSFYISKEIQKSIENISNTELKAQVNNTITLLENKMQESFLLNILFSIFLVIAYSIFLFITNTDIKQRIKSLFDKISLFTQENTDLTNKLTITQNDEIGELSEKINEFIEQQNNNMLKLKEIHQKVQQSVSNLENSVESLCGININFDVLKKNTKNSTIYAMQSLEKTKEYLEDIFKSIIEINENLNVQVVNVQQSTTSVEETLKSISSITKSSKEAISSVSEVLSQSEEGSKAMAEHINAMVELSEYNEGIIDIIEAINNIVKKTNLLAMNASIEAAHAGNAGRGFAVVAQEIRKLAETSSQNIKEITDRMQSVSEKINISSQTVSVAGTSFKSIFKGIKEINRIFNIILESIQEQENNAKEIAKSIGNLTTSTLNIKSISDKQNEKNKDIKNLTTDLIEVSQSINSSYHELENNNDMFKNKIDEIKKVSENNKEIVFKLNEYTEKFKTSNDKSKQIQSEKKLPTTKN